MLSKNKLSILANLILVILMSASICQTLYTSLFMTKNLSLILFIAIVPLTLLFYFMFRNKLTTIVSTIVICISLIIGLLLILFKTGLTNAQIWFYNYSSWFIDVTNGFNDLSFSFYTNLTLVLLAFIITLFVFVFSMKFYNFFVITILFFSVFFIQLQLKIFISNKSFVLFMFSFLLYYFFDILKRRSKESTYEIGSKFNYLVYIIPVCVLIIVFSFLFPFKSTRNSLPWLDSKFDFVINNIIEYFSDKDISSFDYFSINSTGFGKKSRLGGNIKLSKTHVMNVKSEYSNLYLKASSKAFYDGQNWYESNSQLIPLGKELALYQNEINSDSNELETGTSKMSEFIGDIVYKFSTAEIEYVNLKTKSLFIPIKAKSITFKEPKTLFYDNEQMISLNELQKEGFSYTVEYNNMQLKSDEFINKIRKSYKGYYNDLYDNNTQIASNKKLLSDVEKTNNIFDSTALKEDVEVIYRRYTQLPESVTPRVRQLANELTKDKDNLYDKAKAVETYLSSNYPYTLSPGNTPRKKDFVDYFLFEGKKGYCTYYASAMTVLLRCLDIPTRYVEGYILPPKTDENGVFKVTNEQAHAWVEVYFEGFGWIPFEPTSPFLANMYNDQTITPIVSSDMLNSDYMDYMEMIKKYGNTGSSGFTYDNGDIDTNIESETNKLQIVFIIIASIFSFIILVFGILVFRNMIKTYRILRKIKKDNPNNSILLAYNYILKILSVINIEFMPGETPYQFGIRVEKTLDFKGYSFNKISFIKTTDHFINARYSSISLQKADQQDMLDLIDILLVLTIEKMGKLKFVMSKYVFGKI